MIHLIQTYYLNSATASLCELLCHKDIKKPTFLCLIHMIIINPYLKWISGLILAGWKMTKFELNAGIDGFTALAQLYRGGYLQSRSWSAADKIVGQTIVEVELWEVCTHCLPTLRPCLRQWRPRCTDLLGFVHQVVAPIVLESVSSRIVGRICCRERICLDLWLRQCASDSLICKRYRQGIKQPVCLQTSCWKKKLNVSFNQLFCPIEAIWNLSKQGFVSCLGQQHMECVCNNLLWDVCLWCKHWRPQVVVNGRKILRMWQKGWMLNMLSQRRKAGLRRDCAAEFCTQLSFYLPSIVLCLCLSHYAKASGLELTTVGPWGWGWKHFSSDSTPDILHATLKA